jgi:YtoQ family protein
VTDRWLVYLGGEIHSSWRDEIQSAASDLPMDFISPVTVHADSDRCGTSILGSEDSAFWTDHLGASVNAIRTRTALRKADIVVIRFGEKYRQWNAAFDAGQASALGKPLIILHPEEHDHALKEVDAAANAVARTPRQVADLLRYVIEGSLPDGAGHPRP